MSGYLFKRSHSNTFKKWNRRWFTLFNSKLFYQKKNDNSSDLCEMEPDLRVCKVREINDTERRFTFEIVSPKCRHILQADSQKECTLWVKTIDRAINKAINNLIAKTPAYGLNSSGDLVSSNSNGNGLDDSFNNDLNCELIESIDIFNSFNNNNNELNSSNTNGNYYLSSGVNGSSQKSNSFRSLKELENGHSTSSSNLARKIDDEFENKNFLLTTVKGNQYCCDCGAQYPTWISINIGALLCIECSGKHRGLGKTKFF